MGREMGTMVTATVSGTVSEISGGKFANGAVTGAFVHLFNSLGDMLAHANENLRIQSMESSQFREEMHFYGTDEDVGIAKQTIYMQLQKPFVDSMYNAATSAPLYQKPNIGTALDVVQYINPSSNYKYEYNCHRVDSCNVRVYK